GRRRRLRHARSELGRLDAGRHDRRQRAADRRRNRPVRSLRLHGPRRSGGRRGAPVARRAVRDALRQPGAPRNDGPRRAESVAAGTHDRVRSADRRGRNRSVLRAGRLVTLPLFPVTTVGSWPRPPQVAEALRAHRQRRIDRAERDRITDAAVVELLRLQQTLGCDIVTDGELRRDNFYSFVADKLAGVRLMTLAEMLDVVEDKAGFEQLLQTLDVPAYSISSPICTGRLERRAPLA